MRWEGLVARMRDINEIYSDTIGKPEGRNQVEGLGVDGKEKLKTYFQEIGEEVLYSFNEARIGSSGKLL